MSKLCGSKKSSFRGPCGKLCASVTEISYCNSNMVFQRYDSQYVIKVFYVIKVDDLHLCVLEMRVLDSMTDRHLADPLLSSEGGQGVGCGSHLLAFAQFRNTLAHFYSTIDLHPPSTAEARIFSHIFKESVPPWHLLCSRRRDLLGTGDHTNRIWPQSCSPGSGGLTYHGTTHPRPLRERVKVAAQSLVAPCQLPLRPLLMSHRYQRQGGAACCRSFMELSFLMILSNPWTSDSFGDW